MRSHCCKDAKKVHLIAHSMGGLDARYYISMLGGNEHVYSLTTLSTPHRGSPNADYAVERYLKELHLESILKHLHIPTDAFHQCTTSYMADFNEKVLDSPDVLYFSYGGDASESRNLPPLRAMYKRVLEAEGTNDAMVSVESARWGTYLGTFQENHFEMMN
eukprot:TRINITY_DN5960_c0_g1_i2.p2 TRINITY_DN5960_c0_g1~~TRINITY_DN5960_c0_g1_i2.p2  ORF type:complete len:161 (-),score=35.55 TRINITY_DN5960_c0_g1_i2:92-574(-)